MDDGKVAVKITVGFAGDEKDVLYAERYEMELSHHGDLSIGIDMHRPQRSEVYGYAAGNWHWYEIRPSNGPEE